MLTQLYFNFKKYIAWFFPSSCILCHFATNTSHDFCETCLQDLPILPQSCPRCAKTLTPLLCGDCLKKEPYFDATYVLYSYQKAIAKLIMELKFHERLNHARLLGKQMAHAIQHQWYRHQPLPEMIIPVPLHARRLKERGFNQALEIARPIAKQLHIPLNITQCTRSLSTMAQAKLPAEKRALNIKNAFHIHGDLTGYHVAILDDVITTGHTINEFSKALKKAGARRIDVWCCARTPQYIS
jgi:ComF family protein